MSLNKKILTLAIAGLLPSASYAFVDLNVPANGSPVVFPSEFIVDPNTGLVVNNVTSRITVRVNIGNAVQATHQSFFRLDFAGAQLATNLVGPNFLAEHGANHTAFTPPHIPIFDVVSGGNTGDSFVIVRLTAGTSSPGRGIFANDRLVFSTGNALFHRGQNAIRVFNKNPQNITYATYNTLADANNQINHLSGPVTNTWYTWGNSVTAACTRLNSQQIDVTQKHLFIGGGTSTPLFNLSLTLTPGIVIPTTGLAPAGLGDFLGHNSTVKVTGSFVGTATSALDDLGSPSFPNYVGPFVKDVSNTFGTFTLSPAPTTSFNNVPITFISNGNPTTPLAESNYTVDIIPQPGVLPVTFDANFGKLGVCGNLQFSGSSDRLDFVVTPGNPNNRQWFRITNPSDTGGAVFVTVWNDAGQAVEFPLSTVRTSFGPIVNLPGSLPAKASTPVVRAESFYAAAQSVNPAFTIGTGVDGQPGKLRIEVRGAFGDNQVDGARSTANFTGLPSSSLLKNGINIISINSGGANLSGDK